MLESVSEKEIMAAKARSEAALAAIIAKQMPLIRRLARRAVSPGLDFDDAVQEGLIGLFGAIESWNSSKAASFQTYAAVCIRNSIFSARKAAGRKKHLPLNQSVPLSGTLGEGQSVPGPEEQAITNEKLEVTLEKVRTDLSGFEKTVLKLMLDGLSYNEIAGKLGKSTKSVENALSRVRRKLK